MLHLESFETFNKKEINLHNEDANFWIIFESLVNCHLNHHEKLLISYDYTINESWFSDLKDKATRGVLKVTTQAGELLTSLAKKAKDILDFAKQLANQIGEYVKNQFTNLSDKIKRYALKDSKFAEILLDFINKKKDNKLRTYIGSVSELVKYIISGKMITDLMTRLSECFSSVLNQGRNEGLFSKENEFLFEAEETEEKKSFLQRLGEKVMAMEPFTWIPKIEEMLKKGISSLGKLVDKFFSWLLTGKTSMIGSKFGRGLKFIFDILELYVTFKISGQISKFADMLNKASNIEDVLNQAKESNFEEILSKVGLSRDEVMSTFKNAIKKIPFVGDIISILDFLVMGIGIYLAIEPTLKKVG